MNRAFNAQLALRQLEKPSRAHASFASLKQRFTYHIDRRGENEHATPESDCTIDLSRYPLALLAGKKLKVAKGAISCAAAQKKTRYISGLDFLYGA